MLPIQREQPTVLVNLPTRRARHLESSCWNGGSTRSRVQRVTFSPFCLASVAAATTGAIRSRIDGARLPETTVRLGERLVRERRRSPAAGVVVSAATVAVALASLAA